MHALAVSHPHDIGKVSTHTSTYCWWTIDELTPSVGDAGPPVTVAWETTTFVNEMAGDVGSTVNWSTHDAVGTDGLASGSAGRTEGS